MGKYSQLPLTPRLSLYTMWIMLSSSGTLIACPRQDLFPAQHPSMTLRCDQSPLLSHVLTLSLLVLTATTGSVWCEWCFQRRNHALTAVTGWLQRGKQFAETSTRARQTIAELGAGFVQQDAVVMVHGYSRVALALLQQVANNVGTCTSATGCCSDVLGAFVVDAVAVAGPIAGLAATLTSRSHVLSACIACVCAEVEA